MTEKIYDTYLTLRVTAEQLDGLKNAARADQSSVSDLVRELIADRLGE
jgi:uncharacterized protein (DUF1778 family)